jgi:hypothetical protein
MNADERAIQKWANLGGSGGRFLFGARALGGDHGGSAHGGNGRIGLGSGFSGGGVGSFQICFDLNLLLDRLFQIQGMVQLHEKQPHPPAGDEGT